METKDYIVLMVTFLVAWIPAIPGIIAYNSQKKINLAEAQKIEAEAEKTDADAAVSITGAATTLVATMQTDIINLRAELISMRKELESVKDENNRLSSRDIEREAQVQECITANELLWEWAKALSEQVSGYGGTPCPEPVIPSKPLTKPIKK